MPALAALPIMLLSALLPVQDAVPQPDAAALPRRAGPLGIRLETVSEGEIRVREVVPGLPGERAGVRPGDRIRAVAGKPVASPPDLSAALVGRRGGEVVELELRRGEGESLRLPVTLETALERVDGSEVRYDSVTVPGGYRLRTIITEPIDSPLDRDGRRPGFLYVQGITCDSIDRPTMPEAPDTRIVHAMAKAGFVTLRVDKPGVGDSEGPPCPEIDFSTELEGYLAALRQLASLPGVDPERIYVFGHSMGGVMAPYLSAAVPVRGTVVYGTLARTWFEYQLENVRRQGELMAIPDAELTAMLQAEAKTSSLVLVEKKTLGDVWDRWPELRRPTQGLMLDETHQSTRHMRFFHELQDLNLAEAWSRSTGAVLALWGEYDWVSSREDHERIERFVNARTPGAGSMQVIPRADHAFTVHPDRIFSLTRLGQGDWDGSVPEAVLAWIDGLDRVAPPALPAWRKLPTEPYPGKQDDLCFIDARNGWYGNGAGRLYRTGDGGETWTRIWERPGTFIRCLAFVDAKVGVLGNVGPGYFPGVTDPVPLYRTEDGGITWTPVTAIEGPPVAGLCAIEAVRIPFINAGRLDHRVRLVATGRVGGPAVFLWSDDLGVSWKRGTLPEDAAMAFDVHFLDADRGILAAASDAEVAKSNAVILATDDGGRTWEPVHRSTRPYETTWKIAFAPGKEGAEVGYVTIQSYDPDPAASLRYVAKTVDGGSTWDEILLCDDHAVREFGVGFVDADTGWVGAMPHGFGTVDGGSTWTRVDFGNAVNKIRVLRTPDGVVAYAIGVELHVASMPTPEPR